jgi:hypothetical protein
MTSLIGALIGAFGNSKAARTSTSSSTTTPTFDPLQTNVQGVLGNTLLDRLENGVNVTPLRTAGVDQINKTYQGVGDQLTSQLASRGFGKSGEVGEGLQSTALARAGAVGSLENSLDNYQIQEQDKTLADAQQFGFSDPGTSSTGSATGAGSALAGGLTGGFAGYLSQLDGLQAAGAFGSSGSSGNFGLGGGLAGPGTTPAPAAPSAGGW